MNRLTAGLAFFAVCTALPAAAQEVFNNLSSLVPEHKIGTSDLPGEPIQARIGTSVAASNGLVLIGVPTPFGFATGNAHLFDSEGDLLRTFAPVGGIHRDFGAAVALSSNRVLIGATDPVSSNDQGGAYLFSLGGRLLRRLDPVSDQQENYGASLALNDELALVSDRFHDSRRGRVYMYDPNTGISLGNLDPVAE